MCCDKLFFYNSFLQSIADDSVAVGLLCSPEDAQEGYNPVSR